MSFWVLRFALLGLLLLGLPAALGQRASQAFDPNDPLAQALKTSNVYVAPALQRNVSERALRALAAQRPAGQTLKIAVVNQLPASGRKYQTRDLYAEALHAHLRLKRGTLLLVTRRGVSMVAKSPAFPPADVERLLQRYDPMITQFPVEGINSLLSDLDALYNSYQDQSAAPAPAVAASGGAFPPKPAPAVPAASLHDLSGAPSQDSPHSAAAQEDRRAEPATAEPMPGRGGLLPLLALAGASASAGGLAWFGIRTLRMRKAIAAAMLPIQRLYMEIIQGLMYVDAYLDMLPADGDGKAAKQARQGAAIRLDQAGHRVHSGRTPGDFREACGLLEQARLWVDKARQHIERATGGTGIMLMVAGTDIRVTPQTASGKRGSFSAPVVYGLRPESIPAAERAACFFCSRPARASSLTPVIVTVRGFRRTVLVCANDLQTLQYGAIPEVRVVMEEGQSIPWYTARDYDPYHDYNRPPATFAPALGPERNNEQPGGFLFGRMLMHSLTASCPVFVLPNGEITADPQVGVPGVPAGMMGNVGGHAFGPDFDREQGIVAMPHFSAPDAR